MYGFWASGAFVNRFTMLHPERVQAVAVGGVNGMLMLPVENLDSVALPYPRGGANMTFRTYPGVGHVTNPLMVAVIVDFLRTHAD